MAQAALALAEEPTKSETAKKTPPSLAMLKAIQAPEGWEKLKPHKHAENVRMMTEGEFVELIQDIRENGFDPNAPIVLHKGKILDGRNRHSACVALAERGLLSTPPTFAEFVGKDPEGFAERVNVHRRHLTRAERDEAIARLLTASPETSDREIARLTGASDKTVAARREKMESSAEIPHTNKTVGKDGIARGSKRKANAETAESGSEATEGGDNGRAKALEALKSGGTLELTGTETNGTSEQPTDLEVIVVSLVDKLTLTELRTLAAMLNRHCDQNEAAERAADTPDETAATT